MSRMEVNFAIDLAAKEGWNPGLFDSDAFFATDPGAFLIGDLEGTAVGCISAVSYPGNFGFVGFYIIVSEYRGRGFGLQLWNKAIERLSCHNIGLDGVFEQQANYRKSGFKLAYSNIRFEYYPRQMVVFDREPVRDVKDLHFDQLLEYDRLCFPSERRTFLEHWLRMPQSYAFAYTADGEVEGYGMIRKCRVGYKIGPLFANDKYRAIALFKRLSACVESGSPIYLDVPEVNPAGMDLAKEYHMKKVFGTARMYTGAFPDIQTDRVFGVTTFELG
jgi:hypothetical protein